MIGINKKILLKLLKKSLLYRIMGRLDKLIYQAGLTHKNVSNRAGNSDNWFNDAFNNNEDIQISSFTKIIAVLDNTLEIKDLSLVAIFDSSILNIATIIAAISDEVEEHQIKNIINDEKKLFLDIIGDWATLDSKKKITKEEKLIMAQVKNIISQY